LVKEQFSPCVPPRVEVNSPAIPLPAGTWDTHVHVIGTAERYPLAPDRSYTPAPCDFEQYLAFMDVVGIQHAVLVQPSIYGFDNSAMLDTLARYPERLRGIAVLPPDIDDRVLTDMHRLGVRGIRANLLNKGGIGIADAISLTQRVTKLGWHLQVQIDVSVFAEFDSLRSADSEIVIDHMGYMPAGKGVKEPGFQRLLRWLEDGLCWVKLSAPYRLSRQHAMPYADTLPLVHALVSANPDRVLWATDWPHTDLREFMPNDGDLVSLIGEWLPNDELRRRVLTTNPARLYGKE
jgi:2-pyrone-4,6-dicarboxylate lactonase